MHAMNHEGDAMNHDLIQTQTIATAMGPLALTSRDAENVVDAIANAKAANTKRAHESRLATFRVWLANRGMQLIDGVPVPAPVVVTYLCDRWESGRKLNTIDADLAALNYWHAAQGMETPSRDRVVRECFAGLRRKTAAAIRDGAADRAPVRADAAVADIIRRMIRTIDAHAVNESIRLRDRAMLLMGFAMGARRGELAALHAEHLQWMPQGVIVSIWAGKTGDRQSEISYADDASMCAITAVRQWMQHAGITSGPIFRQIIVTPRGDRRAVIGQDVISGQVVNRTFAKWAAAADLPSGRWTAHALRAGFTVQGIMDGVPESELRAQTGHKSAVWLGYAQRAQAFSVRRNTAL